MSLEKIEARDFWDRASCGNELLACFKKVQTDTVLTYGDLVTSSVGKRQKGFLLNLARITWLRWLIKSVMPGNGLFLLIEAVE